MKYKFIYFGISLAVLIPGVVSLAIWQVKPAIDFTGGTLWEVKAEKKIEASVDERIIQVQPSNEGYILRAKPLTETEHQELKQKLTDNFGMTEELRFETLGPILGKQLLRKTMIAVILATSIILLFVAWEFKNLIFGVAAVLAMIHDLLILTGAFSLLGHFAGIEVDTLFVTALLTILSFSVHDTIVVFDRIRETVKRNPNKNFEDVANQAVSETLGRSVKNSATIIFMLLALYFLGGETIKNFALALLIGTIAGTYSSTFCATPLLVVFKKFKK